MGTIQNTFVRKTGDGKAVIIAITDWDENFKDLEKCSEVEFPDLMLISSLRKDPFTGINTMSFSKEATCFSKKFEGLGLTAILKEPVWGFKITKNNSIYDMM